MVKDVHLDDMIVDGKSYRVPDEERVSVGRKNDAGVVILCRGSEITSVSRIHCFIYREDLGGGDVYVKDNSSKNGTYVNGEKIEGKRVLEEGDYLKLGAYVLQVRIFDRLDGILI